MTNGDKSEANERDEFRKLLRGLIESTNKTLASHASGLQSHQATLLTHEKDLSVALQSLKQHADCISVIRTDLGEMGRLINAQNELIVSLQGAVLRIIKHLGVDPPELPPVAVN